jgi:hypothetical protein
MRTLNVLSASCIIAVSIAVFISGCAEQNKSSSKPARREPSSTLNGTTGMAGYLTKLPAVKKITDWENKYAPGITIFTEHYKIHTTLMEPLMLRQLPGFIEAAYKSYQRQLPHPIQTQTVLTVYLFATRDQWEQFTKEFAAPNGKAYLKIKKGAYYLNGSCVAYNIGRTATFSVIAHEGWHQFSSRHFAYRLPSWLDEGIATLFETSKYTGGKFDFYPDRNGGRLGSLRKTLIEKNMIPLKQLITLNPGQVVSDSDAVLAFYGQSYALVRFFREDGYGKRLKRFHNMLSGALRGTWPLPEHLQKVASDRNIPMTNRWNMFISPKLFDMYIEQTPEELEKEYTAFCKKIVYHVRLK